VTRPNDDGQSPTSPLTRRERSSLATGFRQADYDMAFWRRPSSAALLHLHKQTSNRCTYEWEADAEEYPIGFVATIATPTGGVALAMGTQGRIYPGTIPARRLSGLRAKCCAKQKKHQADLATPLLSTAFKAAKKHWLKPSKRSAFQVVSYRL